MKQIIFITIFLVGHGSCFWDRGTTTERDERLDTSARVSFFRWQWVTSMSLKLWFWGFDWKTIERNFRLARICGLSIDLLPLSTGTLLNRRSVITAYNFMDPYMNRQREMRVWAPGRTGGHTTPYRYRVFSVTRLVPLSMNTEHCHGPRCIHQPRHDICIVIVQDQMYLYPYQPRRYLYAYRGYIPEKKFEMNFGDLWMSGSGFEYPLHVHENYKIFHYYFSGQEDLADCSKYTVKQWGKFICLKNTKGFAGVQNGGALFSGPSYVMGLGCFEIRYNEDRVFVFTDVRYYRTLIEHYAHIYPGQYYEYAYPQWGAWRGSLFDTYDGDYNFKVIPAWQIQGDIYPLGKK